MIEKDKINLINYIKTEQSKGVPRAQIEKTLLSQGGWTHIDLTQIFNLIDSSSNPSPKNASGASTEINRVTGWKKLWYLLLLPSSFIGAGMSHLYVYFSYLILGDSEKMAVVGLIVLQLLVLLFNIFVVRGIARSVAAHNVRAAVIKILLFLLLNFTLVMLNRPVSVHNSPRDKNPINETYTNSSLPNVATTTNKDFILLQGQAANLTDIGATIRYTGYHDVGYGGQWMDYTFIYDDPLKGNPKETYDVLFPGLNLDSAYVNLRVEKPESTCENKTTGDSSGCWQSLAIRKNDPTYCLNVSWHTTRKNCISGFATSAYLKARNLQNPEEGILAAREICKIDDTGELNMCTIIGENKTLDQSGCIALIGDQEVVSYNNDFYQECFRVTGDIYPDRWNPKLCESIQYPNIRTWCETPPKEKIN